MYKYNRAPVRYAIGDINGLQHTARHIRIHVAREVTTDSNGAREITSAYVRKKPRGKPRGKLLGLVLIALIP